MNRVYIVMERREDDNREFPVKVCYQFETAERILKDMREAYQDCTYRLYQCPYEQ